MDLWNTHNGGIPFSNAIAFNKRRESKCIERLNECPNLEYWRYLFDHIKWSTMFREKDDNGFLISFDWIISNKENHKKVMDEIEKDFFLQELRNHRLDFLKQYLKPGEELKDLPHYVVYIRQCCGKINRKAIDWASKEILRIETKKDLSKP